MATFVSVGIQSFLATDGLNLPVMTIPFCVTTWLLMSFKTEWLVATVGDEVDLDDALFLNRRHDAQEQAVLSTLAGRETRIASETDSERCARKE